MLCLYFYLNIISNFKIKIQTLNINWVKGNFEICNVKKQILKTCFDKTIHPKMMLNLISQSLEIERCFEKYWLAKLKRTKNVTKSSIIS